MTTTPTPPTRGAVIPTIADPRPDHAEPSPATAELPCPACGAPGAEDDNFCEACGVQLAAAPPAGAPAPSQPRATAQWEVIVTQTIVQTHALEDERLQIGRRHASGAEPEIEIRDAGVSHEHAILERRADGTYEIIDHGSTNGTRINDEPRPLAPGARVELADGDRLQIGEATVLTIRRLPTPQKSRPVR